MRPCWLVLTFAACATRSPQAQSVDATPSMPAAAPTAPTRLEAQLPTDPPYAPCPTPGWASAATLVGGWSTGSSTRSGDRRDGLRHDYEPDGTLRSLHITRRAPPRPERMFGGAIGHLPRPEERRERLGTWRIDESGVRELRWLDGATTRVIRERVWISTSAGFMPYAMLAVRPLERGADGAWRGHVYSAVSTRDGERGHESRIELRFDPPLDTAANGPCTVETRRQLRVWGDGEPATWTGREREVCVIDGDRITLTPPHGSAHRLHPRLEHDGRLEAAYHAFDVRQLDRAAAHVLLAARPWHEPYRRARATMPPILWHDVIHYGHCTPAPPP